MKAIITITLDLPDNMDDESSVLASLLSDAVEVLQDSVVAASFTKES